MGDEWGEIDCRFSYCAVSALSLLGRLDALDKDLTASWIIACVNFDGGYGMVPGAESHAAYGQSALHLSSVRVDVDSELTVWTCVGTLAILDKLDSVKRDMLSWWLCERQLPNGGLNGRPEKLEDVSVSRAFSQPNEFVYVTGLL